MSISRPTKLLVCSLTKKSQQDITVDVSVEKAYEKQEQPLDLMECINFFQMEEFLGEDASW